MLLWMQDVEMSDIDVETFWHGLAALPCSVNPLLSKSSKESKALKSVFGSRPSGPPRPAPTGPPGSGKLLRDGRKPEKVRMTRERDRDTGSMRMQKSKG
jgi:hypothetical protein